MMKSQKKSEIIKPDKGVTGPPDLVEQLAQAQTATQTLKQQLSPSPSPRQYSNQQP
jgi:hypothetical protein